MLSGAGQNREDCPNSQVRPPEEQEEEKTKTALTLTLPIRQRPAPNQKLKKPNSKIREAAPRGEIHKFNDLPAEIRETIWQFAATDATQGRIVHLSRLELRPTDEVIAERIRVDRELSSPSRSEYISPRWDEKGMPRDEMESWPPYKHLVHLIRHDVAMQKMDNRPVVCLEDPGYGYRSESPIPPLLLVNWEAHLIASPFYPRAFTSPGSDSFPQTFFDFRRDTLFLDSRSVTAVFPWAFSMGRKYNMFQDMFGKADMVRVEKLAFNTDTAMLLGMYTNRYNDGFWVWVYQLHERMESLKEVTLLINSRREEFLDGCHHDYANVKFKPWTIRRETRRNVDVMEHDEEPVWEYVSETYFKFQMHVQDLVDRARLEWKWEHPEEPWRFPKIQLRMFEGDKLEMYQSRNGAFIREIL